MVQLFKVWIFVILNKAWENNDGDEIPSCILMERSEVRCKGRVDEEEELADEWKNRDKLEIMGREE